jgi:hypothetical protein
VALVANDMADFVIAEMRNGASSQNIMDMMGHAMAKYLRENTEVTFSWSGINPIPESKPPDPVTQYKTTDVTGDMNLVHTKTNDPDAASLNLALQIQKECANFTVGPASGWGVPRIVLNNHSPPPIAPTKTNDQLESMRKLCNWVITMYKTYINPTPLMGSHGVFLAPPGGGAVMTKIS